MQSKLHQQPRPIPDTPPYQSMLEAPVIPSTKPRCPKCKKLTLNEREDSLTGTIHHSCSMSTCGYFMVWSARKTHFGIKPGEPPFPIIDVTHARWLNVENDPRYVLPELPKLEGDWDNV